jgi:membrane fusion protein (multidrug efflux system)
MGRRVLIGGVIVVTLAVLGYAGYAWHYARTHVSTDDAYVEGNIAPIAAKIVGRVVEVAVDDNRVVKAGDLLVRIDPREYEARRDQARAAVAVAGAAAESAQAEVPLARETTRAQADEARAALESARVAERSAEAGVAEVRARVEAKRAAAAAMQAEIAGAESNARQARREAERMRRLAQDGFVAQRDFDLADSALATNEAQLEAVQRRFTQAEKEVQQAEAELAARVLAVAQARERITEARAALGRAESQRHQVTVKEAEVGRGRARLVETQADLTYAELQLQHAEVRAPAAGVVSKKSVEVGQVVQVGQPLLAIVPLEDVWVVANFKETQLGRIRPGMTAEVHVDTFPDVTFRGTVESLAAGTGARFSLLPPENATGNWVKVVQRVPVKIRLEPRQSNNPHTLRAGLSAYVTVRVR